MSWQAYVDNNLVGSKQLEKAAIHGLDGAKWATSAGFAATQAEVKAIVAGFSKPDAIRNSGITAQGVKYFTLQAGDRSIYGKKVTFTSLNSFLKIKLSTGCWWYCLCQDWQMCFDCSL
jgi:profilin